VIIADKVSAEDFKSDNNKTGHKYSKSLCCLFWISHSRK